MDDDDFIGKGDDNELSLPKGLLLLLLLLITFTYLSTNLID